MAGTVLGVLTYERGLRHSSLVVAACPGNSPPRFPLVGLLCHHLDPAPTSSSPSSTARPQICPSAPSGTPPVSPMPFSSPRCSLQSSPYLTFVFRGASPPRSFLDPLQGFPTFSGPSLATTHPQKLKPQPVETTSRGHAVPTSLPLPPPPAGKSGPAVPRPLSLTTLAGPSYLLPFERAHPGHPSTCTQSHSPLPPDPAFPGLGSQRHEHAS